MTKSNESGSDTDLNVSNSIQDTGCYVKGYFPLDNQRTASAPENLLTEAPVGKQYAEVFQDGIVCIQMEYTPHAKRILRALDSTLVHYTAMATLAYLRLFFSGDIGRATHAGYIMTGSEVEMCGTNGYIEHTGGSWRVIHEDADLSQIPQWLYPVDDISPLNSKTSMLGESRWINYLSIIFDRLRGSSYRQRQVAYEETINSAIVLNEFRTRPFGLVRMLSFLHIMEFTKPDFYEAVTDSKGREKKVFLKDKFSEWYIERYKLINLGYLPYAYSNGIYRYMPAEEVEQSLMKYLPNTNESIKREVRKSIFSLLGVYSTHTSSRMDQAFDVAEPAPPNLIAFENGILDVNDAQGSMKDFSEEIHITNRIPYPYVDYGPMIARGEKTEAMKLVDYWLDSFTENNTEKRRVLEEVAGLCFYKTNTGLRRHNTFLVGPKESGKSLTIKMLAKLVGEENTSYCSVEDICNLNSRFTVVNMVDRILNISADVSKRGIWEASRLKNLTTGDKVYVEQKGHPLFEMSFYGKMVFGCNELPVIKDDAIPSRFEFIPCTANFSSSSDKCIPNLYDMLTTEECMTYWVYLAVEGLRRFIGNKYRHTYCAENEVLRRKYERISNPVESFIESREDDSWLDMKTSEVYEMYMDFLIKDLHMPECECNLVTANSLTRSFKRLGYDVKRKFSNGVKIQVYTRPQ